MKQTNEKEYYYLPKDLTRIFKCSDDFVYNNLLKLRGFPYTKLGSRYFIPIEAFDKWVRENTGTEIEL